MLEMLVADEPTVIVSLPKNDMSMAKAATDAGADGIKVHLNATHRASGTTYGSLEEEKETLQKLCSLDTMVGVVPGQDVATVHRTLSNLSEFPIDFVDGFAHHLPAGAKEMSEVTTWAAPTNEYNLEEVCALDQTSIDAVEAALFSKEEYGSPFSVRHLAKYLSLARSLSLPVIVPTQLDLTPDDAVRLEDNGITNFLLGSIVIGSSPESIYDTTSEFVTKLK